MPAADRCLHRRLPAVVHREEQDRQADRAVLQRDVPGVARRGGGFVRAQRRWVVLLPDSAQQRALRRDRVQERKPAATHKPIPKAIVTAHYGVGSDGNDEGEGGSGGIFVTRRESSKDGIVRFSGWAGRTIPKPHRLRVEVVGYTAPSRR